MHSRSSAHNPWLLAKGVHLRVSKKLAYHGPVPYAGEGVMTVGRADLDAMLDRLKASLPKMIADHPHDGDFWSEFAGHADAIEDAASASDYEHVRSRIDAMLSEQALTFGDND